MSSSVTQPSFGGVIWSITHFICNEKAYIFSMVLCVCANVVRWMRVCMLTYTQARGILLNGCQVVSVGWSIHDLCLSAVWAGQCYSDTGTLTTFRKARPCSHSITQTQFVINWPHSLGVRIC